MNDGASAAVTSPTPCLPRWSDNAIKSKQRVADHGEVFTPPWLVEKMLDLVAGETERIDSRFLDGGTVNFVESKGRKVGNFLKILDFFFDSLKPF